MKKTLLLKNTEEEILTAAEIVAAGGLVAFPTETVYGLGADALCGRAVSSIYEAKGRPTDNPTIVHIADQDDIYRLIASESREADAGSESSMSESREVGAGSESPMSESREPGAGSESPVSTDMKKLMDAFWPGPLTMVVNKGPAVPLVTTGGLDTIGIRMPSSEAALALIRKSGCPIAAPSANLSGKPSPTTAQHVAEDMDGRIDAIIDDGPCHIGIESTVLDMTGDVPMILRPGYITKEDLEQVLGKPVEIDPALMQNDSRDDFTEQCRSDDGRPALMRNNGRNDLKPKAPGMKYRHYAPKAEMIVFQLASPETEKKAGGDGAAQAAASTSVADFEKLQQAMLAEEENLKQQGRKVAVILFREGEEEEAARSFFGQLRQADDMGADVILAAALPEKGIGFSVMNRMLKAAGYNIRKV